MFGSRPHVRENSPEVCCIQCDRIPQGKKCAISIARNFTSRKRNFTGERFWARGYYVSTVGLDEESVKKYIREQEAEDARLEQLNMLHAETPPSGAHEHAPLRG